MTYKDKTFCASKDCKGTCGRKLTEADHAYLKSHSYIPVSMSLFCEDDTEDISNASLKSNPKDSRRESSDSVANNSSLAPAQIINTNITIH